MPESIGNSTHPTPLLPAWTETICNYETKRVMRACKRAEKKGLTPTLTLEQWLTSLHAHKFTCFFCGGAAESLEHVEPLWAGGNTTAENCKPACKACNQGRNFVAWGVHYFNKAVAEQSASIADDLFALITPQAREMVLLHL